MYRSRKRSVFRHKIPVRKPTDLSSGESNLSFSLFFVQINGFYAFLYLNSYVFWQAWMFVPSKAIHLFFL